jgi:hypothetical protein
MNTNSVYILKLLGHLFGYMQSTEQAVKAWLVHWQKLVTAKADNVPKLTADLEADAAPYLSS